jgi:hypothetical protein
VRKGREGREVVGPETLDVVVVYLESLEAVEEVVLESEVVREFFAVEVVPHDAKMLKTREPGRVERAERAGLCKNAPDEGKTDEGGKVRRRDRIEGIAKIDSVESEASQGCSIRRSSALCRN